MYVRMMRKNDQAIVLETGVLANDFMSRLQGLIGKTQLSAGEGILFPKCNSIHMWMMQIPIDVVFLQKQSQEWEILALHPGLKPWKILPVWCKKADDVLELPAGTIARLSLKKGESLCIVS